MIFKVQLASGKGFLACNILMNTIYIYHITQVAEETVFLTLGKSGITRIIAKEGLV